MSATTGIRLDHDARHDADLVATRDANGESLDGAGTTVSVCLPAIPENRFWSVMTYDRQTRSVLQTEQPTPSLGGQSGNVEQNPDGSTDLSFGPWRRQEKRAMGSRPISAKGWFPILRLQSPLQPPSDDNRRPSEIPALRPGYNGNDAATGR